MFLVFLIKGCNGSEVDNIILDGWVLRNPHFKIFFGGFMLLASKLDPRGTPLG